MPLIQTAQLLEKTITVAHKAGELLKMHGAGLREISFQDANDVKLKADTDSEALIRDELAHTGWPVVGEELGGDIQLQYGQTPYWVVDPLDGTYNYLREMPLCCVSIGLMQGLEPLLGVIYDFNNDTCYAAKSNGDLLINGNKHTPRWVETEEEACIAGGFTASMNKTEEDIADYLKLISRFKKTRMIGSAAMAIAYMIAGQVDVYYERGVRLWDVAGGLALAKAAGAEISLQPYLDKDFAYTVCIAARKEWLI